MTLDLAAQRELARRFAALHRQDHPLVLPNAWDAGSACVIQDAGAPAIATTSGGCAWSIGVPDGNQLTREQAVQITSSIVGAVSVPVSADIETGYGATLDDLRTTISDVLAAGAVGINIEDSGQDPLYAPEEQAERIAAVRDAAEAYGVPLFINARTDVFLFAVGEESGRLDDVISRAKMYAEAGADGIFVPGLLDLDALRTLTSAVDLPVNAMIGPGAPSVAELAGVGVRRISAGTALIQAVYGHARRATREMLEQGTYTALEESIDYATLNTAFGNRD